MRYPKDLLRPPVSIRPKSEPDEDDDYDRLRGQLHTRPFTNALIARGFNLQKIKSNFVWKGRHGVKFTEWFVAAADRSYSRDLINNILTAVDLGASQVEVMFDPLSDELKAVGKFNP